MIGNEYLFGIHREINDMVCIKMLNIPLTIYIIINRKYKDASALVVDVLSVLLL
jgi:hypothetical protein